MALHGVNHTIPYHTVELPTFTIFLMNDNLKFNIYLQFLAFYYIKQCHLSDPNINQCLRLSTNYLVAHIRRGIPELGLGDPEPVLIDEIQLALGTGPDGYRATFRDIEAYGVSNCTVTAVR